jgi:DNA repair protein RadA/Sms
MAKPRTRYLCSACQAEHSSWFGQCPTCKGWNSLEQIQISRPRTGHAAGSASRAKPLPISQVALGDGGEVRLSTGIGELDRVLGGGLVSGSLSLIGGDPGVGKSTLLLMALARLASRGMPVLYVSGEESARQVRLRADRLGVSGDSLYLLSETDLELVQDAVRQVKPRFLVLDSVQVMRDPNVDSLPGGPAQVRSTADRAMGIAKGMDVATVLVGHVTRDGTIAGPKLLEHLVDTVIYFECDGRSPLRVLRAVKNRFGATGELGLFEMGDAGLLEVPDASARLLAERDREAAGTAVVVAMEGSRPLLCELQALVGSPGPGTPARHALGVERARVNLLLAVLEKAGLPLMERDVYVSAAGGVRLAEPAVDLAVLAAVASSLADKPVPPDLAFFGEVGLTGEVRSVTYPALRLSELGRNGFTRAVVPAATAAEPPPGVELIGVRTVRQVLDLVLGQR